MVFNIKLKLLFKLKYILVCNLQNVSFFFYVGVISGESKTNIHVMFTPTEYVTAHMSMQLNISQFNTKPMLCEVTASCQPPETNYLTR